MQIFYMVNIDVPAGVGGPPLDTQLLLHLVYFFLCHNIEATH